MAQFTVCPASGTFHETKITSMVNHLSHKKDGRERGRRFMSWGTLPTSLENRAQEGGPWVLWAGFPLPPWPPCSYSPRSCPLNIPHRCFKAQTSPLGSRFFPFLSCVLPSLGFFLALPSASLLPWRQHTCHWPHLLWYLFHFLTSWAPGKFVIKFPSVLKIKAYYTLAVLKPHGLVEIVYLGTSITQF